MVPLNYHHLYYFWTVARAGSIAAATERLSLSQPALSGQLKTLERACGAVLFTRGRRGVTLTPEGRVLFERCERIFPEGEELASLIRNGFDAPPVLRLGVQPTVSREVVLAALAFARRAHPASRVTILSGSIEALGDKLERQAIDFVIANEDPSSGLGRAFRARLVARLPVYFVASREVQKLVRRFPRDLGRSAMLLRPAGNPVRQDVERYLQRHQVQVRVEADSDDSELLRRLALDGRGVAVFSAPAIAPDLRSGALRRLHEAPLGLHEPVWFCCGPHPRAESPVRRVIERLMTGFTA